MFSDENLRHLENLRVAYEKWREIVRGERGCGARLQWKTVAGRDYLYEMNSRSGSGRSKGPRSAETEALFNERQQCRSGFQAQREAIQIRLDEMASMHRSMGLPRVDGRLGRLLREFDLSGLLGDSLMVVGTNAMAAYEIEAQTRFAHGIDSTLDADFAWKGQVSQLTVASSSVPPIMGALRRINEVYTVNSEKTFQAREDSGYEVEILIAPSLADSYPKSETIRPIPLPEQEWLLLGRAIEAVTFDIKNRAVRLVVPDPRWLALHKSWLSEKPTRDRKKFDKDRKQAEALAQAVVAFMPGFRVDAAFRARVPDELQPHLLRLFGS